jgi:hypothetical protein
MGVQNFAEQVATFRGQNVKLYIAGMAAPIHGLLKDSINDHVTFIVGGAGGIPHAFAMAHIAGIGHVTPNPNR